MNTPNDSMNTPTPTVVELSFPTVFPDLNAKEGMDAGYARSQLKISRLKFSHLTKMQTLAEDKQMIYAMTALTGLTERDLDELDAADVGNVMGVVYGFMEGFFKLARKMQG